MSALSANPANERRFAKRQTLFAHWDRVHDLLRSLFPVKTAAHLAAITNTSQRGWELSLRERRSFASETLVALLDTVHGPQILLTLLEHSQQPWVRDFKALWQIERLKAERADLDRRIAALSNGSAP